MRKFENDYTKRPDGLGVECGTDISQEKKWGKQGSNPGLEEDIAKRKTAISQELYVLGACTRYQVKAKDED